jgi:hypothetical protein
MVRSCRALVWTGFVALTASAVMACERARVEHPGPQVVRVQGCLTAADGDMVLTQLTAMADAPDAAASATTDSVPRPQATEMYRLVGAESELRPHVGQQVRVVGEADPPEVAIVRQTTPPAAPRGAAADDVAEAGGDTPTVSTTRQLRLEATELRVMTVTPLDRPCDS